MPSRSSIGDSKFATVKGGKTVTVSFPFAVGMLAALLATGLALAGCNLPSSGGPNGSADGDGGGGGMSSSCNNEQLRQFQKFSVGTAPIIKCLFWGHFKSRVLFCALCSGDFQIVLPAARSGQRTLREGCVKSANFTDGRVWRLAAGAAPGGVNRRANFADWASLRGGPVRGLPPLCK
jgi:hypothetical protein